MFTKTLSQTITHMGRRMLFRGGYSLSAEKPNKDLYGTGEKI
jgi:hypothetical protein